jgi:two-component system NtrC family sensor kinase
VAMQQSYAKVAGVLENLSLQELLEDAMRIASAALARHKIEVVRQFEHVPPVLADRHKVLQILVNLINNAKHALDHRPERRQLILRVARGEGERVRVEVTDNGGGIPPENLTRIFQHGFTTKKNGHGFGLHSGANAAREMGGSLTVESDGPGKGARFILELPVQGIRAKAEASPADGTIVWNRAA